MKALPLILSCIVMTGCSGTPPTNLGVTNKQLATCPDSPNCVSSFADKNDSVHFIEPIHYKSIATIRAKLEKAITSSANATIIKSEPRYIYAEFQSRLMKYIDDVEFYISADQQVIHVRSASRLGYGDLGVNRKRIDALRIMIADDVD